MDTEALLAVATFLGVIGILVSAAVALLRRMRPYALATLASSLACGAIGSAASGPYTHVALYFIWTLAWAAPGFVVIGLLACVTYLLRTRTNAAAKPEDPQR